MIIARISFLRGLRVGGLSVECGGKPMELPASCRRLPHPHRGDLQGVGSPLASGEGIVSSFSVYASSNLLMLTLECIEEPVHC